MQKQIELQNKKVDYTLKTSQRAKRMRLTIYCGGSLVVTRPRGLSENIVERFIQQKSAWVLSKLAYFKQFEGKVFKDTRKEYLAHRDKALDLALSRIKHFNRIYNFEFNKISVRSQKTRWGSCSKKGNLNFNYKILFLPEGIADYIIVHELCHLKEFNHSQKFWNLVALALPDYAGARKHLRKKGIRFY